MRRLTIHTSGDQTPLTPPDATGTTERPLDEGTVYPVPAAPRVLEIPVTAARTPVTQAPPITVPAPPLIVQAAKTPRESTETPQDPLAVTPIEITPDPSRTAPPPPLFLEPWLTRSVEASPTVAAPPLVVQSVETPPVEPLLEPWLTSPGEHPTPQTEASSPKKTVKRSHANTATRKHRKEPEADRKRSGNRRVLFTALRDVFISIALLFVVMQFFAPSVVREHSMENTLEPNEILYVTKQAYWFGPPGYNDIVIFQSDIDDGTGTEKTLVKRIIGIPGDRIAIQGGTVYRNGEPLDEPYTKSGTTPGSMNEVVVPVDSYFVLGDNREVSRDSRSSDVGFVAREQLRGQVLVRVFPLDKFTIF